MELSIEEKLRIYEEIKSKKNGEKKLKKQDKTLREKILSLWRYPLFIAIIANVIGIYWGILISLYVPPQSWQDFLYFLKPNAEVEQAYKRPSTHTVTIEKYNQIKEGMTYKEVITIMGNPETEVNKGGNLKAYQWMNPDYSGVSISFLNDVVISKNNLDLK